MHGNLSMGTLRYLLEECDAEVNAVDNDGRSVVYYVLHCGLPFVRYLVEICNADVNTGDRKSVV